MNDNDEQLVAFGEFVRAQRRLAQVSQRNLARMSGVSDSYLSQIERGNYRPSPQVVKALATAFGLEPRQLYMMLGFMDEAEVPGPSVEQARRAFVAVHSFLRGAVLDAPALTPRSLLT